MKPSMLLAFAILWSTSASATGDPCEEFVTLVSKKMDIYYFKLCKDLDGALVQVYSENDSLLVSSKIEGNRFLVDFYFERAGTYIIKVKLEGLEKKFEYVKREPPPLAVAHLDYQIVIAEQ